LWAGVYDAGSNAHDIGKTCALDIYGDIYVASETSIPSVTHSDFITLKYGTSGGLAWATRYNGVENVSDYPTAMAVITPPGPIGSVQNPVVYLTGISNNDVITLKYSQPTLVGGRLSPTAPAAENMILHPRINTYPNPVDKYVNIEYELPSDARVAIAVYDVNGRQVMQIADRFRKAGSHAEKINTSMLFKGMYYWRFTARSGDKEFRESKTILVQR
jgi:hypothetical protein